MTEVNLPAEEVPTRADTRRALEALGVKRGTDRSDLTVAALDAYSVVFEASGRLYMHHEHAVLEAVAAAGGVLRRLWEAERREQVCAEVRDISNARHIHVQRAVDRFIDRCNGNVSEDEITKRYQQGVDQWNEAHPALIALWRRHETLREESKVEAGESP